MHAKRRSNSGGMNNGGGGQHRHHSNNRPRRFGNNPGRSGEDSGNVTRTRRNAQQQREKYQNMARDAMSMGDRVLAENYLQHADHYHRVILSLPPEEQPRQQNQPRAEGAGNQDGQTENGDSSSDNEHDRPMPSADALPSFITQQSPNHPPQNFDD